MGYGYGCGYGYEGSLGEPSECKETFLLAQGNSALVEPVTLPKP